MAILKHNNNSISNVTSFPLVPSGSLKLLATATASSSASLSFDSTYINSDYLIYKFEFIDIHPSVNNTRLGFNLSTDNGSNYNVTKTTTSFWSYHFEDDTATGLEYSTAYDLAQSTSDQSVTVNIGNENDETASGTLTLFNLSSTTFVKHFMSNTSSYNGGDALYNLYIAGYGNTTSAVNAIRFQMSSGNIDAGQIKLYGLGAN
jgi:hypothetical protein